MSRNVLILMSDQHTPTALGCAGDPLAETPALDALATRGTRFSGAWCNAPVCVPSRASLATGLPIHEIPAWDNADPYHGQRTSFMHRARDGGVETASVGKLHFRNAADDVGFDEQLLPMHVVNGTGTFTSLLRDPIPRIEAASSHIRNAGPGVTDYTRYDEAIRDRAVRWLTERRDDRPFLLFVSFVNPHPPYVAPPDLFERFMARDLPPADATLAPRHPALDGLRQYFDLDRGFTADEIRRATAAYYANVAHLDDNIGAVLAASDAAGRRADTTVIYASDHGEGLGRRGLWGKCSMFEESVGVPLIMAGPDVPQGVVRQTPAQLLDLYPTVIDALDLPPAPADAARRGRSLLMLAAEPDRTRWIVAQQHSAGAPSGVYALTDGRLKYVHTVGAAPMLFDLSTDPGERTDLAGDPAHAATLARMEVELRARLDPSAVDAAARASQARRLDAAGGADAVNVRPASAHTPAPRAP